MYARLVMFTLGPGTRSTGEKLADQFAPAIRAKKGFKRVTFFLDDTASMQKKIERQKLFSAGHQPAPGHVPLSPGLCLTCPAVCYT